LASTKRTVVKLLVCNYLFNWCPSLYANL